VRAAVLRALRLGVVEIIVEPTPTTTSAPGKPEMTEPGATLIPTVLDLAGETTLDEARSRAGFPVRLPTFPPDLGPPDRVFLQDLGGPAVVLVWLEPERPERVHMSLHQLGPGAFVWKVEPVAVEETKVHGQRALWTDGPYMLETRRSDLENRRLVKGHVLIWSEGEITYRLETDLSLEDAVRIAESLQ